ncbi:phosphinothricin N-acetyltransferase [Methylopila jiangsuensis]|uniref:Phosphinothricin N-acetyltransferase n=1 Tax=Methylopila jiangsuensis TaxID=586230 RepID=A0A9W6JJR1_9HYPH|nr:GNAT family N-acetyltransferase [Methylopila jiangsuensis]MDR6286525.1 phosphinothricin acetyltransferase [Methylopila jiangsuensis]GLK77135.1 phosphinothricin N-acetyltransferase [Methylopila jiangsuensis]
MKPPHGALAVRDARDADLPAIAAIYADHVLNGTASFEIEPPDADAMGRRIAAVREAGLPWLVAERDGAILGYAYAGPYRARPAYDWTIEDSIYVAESARGQGAGRALLETLIARCEQGPWRQMVAVIGGSDNAGSIGLHAALGFQPAGNLRAVGFKFGRWIDSVFMQRPLGPGESAPAPPRGG